jgi:hypothetical protein
MLLVSVAVIIIPKNDNENKWQIMKTSIIIKYTIQSSRMNNNNLKIVVWDISKLDTKALQVPNAIKTNYQIQTRYTFLPTAECQSRKMSDFKLILYYSTFKHRECLPLSSNIATMLTMLAYLV